VRSEIARIVGFWTQLGVDGFRVDAVPFLISPPGAADETDPHAFLRELHRFVGRRRGDAVLLGEVGLPQQEQLAYFGESQAELDLQFDFETAQAIFLALVRGDARPVAESLRRRPPVDVRQGWVTFLRNHDELSLEMLAPDERDEVFQALAPDERQRVYGRGIVRRLAPMLRGDPRRIRLAYSLMFSLPGAPMLFYGEEIGMGELEGRGDRRAVRTPMQWRNARNGGFSDAKPSRLVREIPDGGYGVAHVNVHDQLRAPESQLGFIKTLIARYRAAPEIAWGRLTLHDVHDPQVLVHSLRTDDTTFLAAHSFGDEARRIELDADAVGPDLLVDLLQPVSPVEVDRGRFVIDLDGWGFRWFRAGAEH